MTPNAAKVLADQARALLAEREEMAAQAQARRGLLRQRLGPKQAAFLHSAAPRRAFDGSRQSGKSDSIATLLIDTALESKCESMYVAPTSKSARKAVWSKFYSLNDRFKLGIDMREGSFEARFPNGSVVGFEGAHDTRRVERLRGATISGVLCVDEAAFFPDALLKKLLGSVATAMFLTTRQKIVVASSPGLQRRGHFFDLIHRRRDTWEHHHLTVNDNPAIKDPELSLRELREANAWTEAAPAYQREGLGLWVDDETHNVYELGGINLIDALPVGKWNTIITVDFGKNDQSAIAVVGWLDHDPSLYVLHVEGHSDLDIEDVCQLVLPMIERWSPISVYGDPGGGGAQHMDYMKKRHGIPIRPVAKGKHYKKPAIDALNADMRRGHYKVLRTSPLVEQMQALQWDPTELAKGVWEEHPLMPNDLCDVAGVYAHVQAKHFRAEPLPPPPPVVGTKEFLEQLSNDGLRQAIEEANRIQEQAAANEEDRAYLLGGDV